MTRLSGNTYCVSILQEILDWLVGNTDIDINIISIGILYFDSIFLFTILFRKLIFTTI